MVLDKNIKAIIFDFDGTLFHLNIEWRDLKNRLASIGVMDITSIESLEADKRQLALEMIQQAEADGIVNGEAAPDALNVLNVLKRDYALALVSRNLKGTLEEGLKKIGYTDAIITIGREDVRSPKPDPQGFRYALKELGVNSDQAIIVGDTNHDVEAGKAIDVPVYVVHNPSLVFQPEGAQKYIASLSDLIDN
jgi:HAD superfamily hydrolase (TIGR01549 family)